MVCLHPACMLHVSAPISNSGEATSRHNYLASIIHPAAVTARHAATP